jgi:beta-glucosidase/6-phospho-beta-glucosidase/beta-galactosidase
MIIDRYHNFFRTKLDKFNDDVKMSMSFVDENNVTSLK